MISRHWKGIVKPGEAGTYIRHLRNETFPALASLRGFVQASILRRELPSGTEFQIVTVWDSLDAIAAFAGDQLDVAVVPPAVQAILTGYDRQVEHYEIAETFVPGAGR
jgi:heme-degrading monooxygenase HmoA